MTLAAPEYEEMNGQVEVTWRTLRTVAHSRMVHARVLEAYVHFALMYTTDHIFPVLPIKYLIIEDGDPTTPHKLATDKKPSVSQIHVLFCPCVVRKSRAHIETKTLNIRHQAQKEFCGIFVGIPQHQKGYLLYVTSTRKIIYSYNVVFDKSFSSALAYTSRPYSEAIAILPAVTYTRYATYSKEQTGDVITISQFEEGNILTETRNDAESGDESDNKSIIMSEQDMENINSGDKSDHDLISTEMLEDIHDGSQTHPNVNRRETLYKICDCIRQRQLKWKGVLKATRSMGKGLHKVFSTVVKEISQELKALGEYGPEVSLFIPESRNFAKVTKLSENIKKPWLKAALKEINTLIHNQTFQIEDQN